MKRSIKKALIVGSVFAAAMNFNACAYGSPQGVNSINQSESTDASTNTVEGSEKPVESESGTSSN